VEHVLPCSRLPPEKGIPKRKNKVSLERMSSLGGQKRLDKPVFRSREGLRLDASFEAARGRCIVGNG